MNQNGSFDPQSQNYCRFKERFIGEVVLHAEATMPGAEFTAMDNSCQALCHTLVMQNGLQPENTDISQSVLYTSIMGLLLVTDEKELQLGSGQVGLRNVGNTCFLNAIVQCLSHTRSLRDYCLLKVVYLQDKHSNQEPVLMNEFSNVLAGLWDCDGGETTVNPGKFYHIFKEAVPYFSGYSQQDAQEFLRFLLDRLHTEINRQTSKHPAVIEMKEPTCTRFRISEEAFAMWQRHLDRDDSKIVDLFSGQLQLSSLHCSVCSHYSNTFDVFCDLSLPIPKKSNYGRIVTLRECLDLFSQEENLDKEKTPMCERCNRHTKSTKRLTIQRFPRILVLHLNRFTMSRYSICKSTVSVSFPLTGLDMGPFGPVDCGPVLYDLYAVCNHSGTVNMGHYMAACRVEEGWCNYNDSCVSTISEEKLQSNQAYVLFYELKSCSISRK
ncbi:LOW QUALITY PROTEIN: ubiquitin carboxyl-terminal hydrolase 21 [Xyrauchen texanus]|uniref:LOW QUALITY PROTEIN: ubiquitin carboxyl-terminal hydrolase 21 n=1 Tax=Xyrauchen texanus TaxID=154827 RepID=UPI002242771D|nr:LOW QUALITY PROTEIN: ubiquitin carboxyl-terminal hydrolase 21 [Xyrauchen texanus]